MAFWWIICSVRLSTLAWLWSDMILPIWKPSKTIFIHPKLFVHYRQNRSLKGLWYYVRSSETLRGFHYRYLGQERLNGTEISTLRISFSVCLREQWCCLYLAQDWSYLITHHKQVLQSPQQKFWLRATICTRWRSIQVIWNPSHCSWM